MSRSQPGDDENDKEAKLALLRPDWPTSARDFSLRSSAFKPHSQAHQSGKNRVFWLLCYFFFVNRRKRFKGELDGSSCIDDKILGSSLLLNGFKPAFIMRSSFGSNSRFDLLALGKVSLADRSNDKKFHSKILCGLFNSSSQDSHTIFFFNSLHNSHFLEHTSQQRRRQMDSDSFEEQNGRRVFGNRFSEPQRVSFPK